MGEGEGIGESSGGKKGASLVEGVDDGRHGGGMRGKWRRGNGGNWEMKMRRESVFCVCK